MSQAQSNVWKGASLAPNGNWQTKHASGLKSTANRKRTIQKARRCARNASIVGSQTYAMAAINVKTPSASKSLRSSRRCEMAPRTQGFKTVRPIQDRYGSITVSLVDCWNKGTPSPPEHAWSLVLFASNCLNTCPIEQRAVNPVKSIGDFTMSANHAVVSRRIGIGSHTHEMTPSQSEVLV